MTRNSAMIDAGGVNEAISLTQRVIKLGKSATNIQYEEALLASREAIFELREENLRLREENQAMKQSLEKIEAGKVLTFAEGHNYLIDPENPKRHLCPLCSKKHSAPIPLDGTFCRQCKGYYE